MAKFAAVDLTGKRIIFRTKPFILELPYYHTEYQ